jgi:hypothetical protein
MKRATMNNLEQSWRKLTRAARQALPRETPSAPYGFAHRVVARWLGEPADNSLEVWAFLAGRVLVGAAIIMAGVVALNYSQLAGTWNLLNDSGPLLETVLSL